MLLRASRWSCCSRLFSLALFPRVWPLSVQGPFALGPPCLPVCGLRLPDFLRGLCVLVPAGARPRLLRCCPFAAILCRPRRLAVITRPTAFGGSAWPPLRVPGVCGAALGYAPRLGPSVSRSPVAWFFSPVLWFCCFVPSFAVCGFAALPSLDLPWSRVSQSCPASSLPGLISLTPPSPVMFPSLMEVAASLRPPGRSWSYVHRCRQARPVRLFPLAPLRLSCFPFFGLWSAAGCLCSPLFSFTPGLSLSACACGVRAPAPPSKPLLLGGCPSSLFPVLCSLWAISAVFWSLLVHSLRAAVTGVSLASIVLHARMICADILPGVAAFFPRRRSFRPVSKGLSSSPLLLSFVARSLAYSSH